MKPVKIVLIVIAVIIAIPLITAIFVKKTYHVEREIVINHPKDVVFDYVKFLKNQDNFSKWGSIDPEMDKIFTGVDGTVGFVSVWDSEDENVGKGEQEILNIVEGERIDYELRFIEPFESTSIAFMITESVLDNKTKVTWGFDGHMKYPMNLMLLFIDFEKGIGEDFAVGLKNLKAELEK